MITMNGLTKRFGERTAVDGLTLDIASGRVTGFLGPNGAGKSTTMRMVLGLDRPTAGTALVNGRPYAELRHPLREVGALLDAKAVHPGRSVRAHLLAAARSNGIPGRRVDEVLELVGLEAVARRRAGTLSLGMGQRLGIAGALLGDPAVLMFDEPVNGLDPDGVLWMRRLMRSLAAEGRTVFVSSHLMSEMQLTADRLVVIGRGRLLADAPIGEVVASGTRVLVRSPRSGELAARLTAAGFAVTAGPDGELTVSDGTRAGAGAPGVSAERIGLLAHEAGIPLFELSVRKRSLEEAYMELTGASVEFGVAEARA
ncbi:ATP-binding cassette domain-containing protein [Actinomadura gamaensis]|uniref:ATP-binding cassette domain-containing protein n=1 Tax=Actinomadura gamaensis TaxID=1763541 RepID=A0ABV9U788_9ACTN